MLIHNPARFAAKLAASSPLSTIGGVPLSQQQLQTMLQDALQRIQTLEMQLATLLQSIHVDSNGNVEISTAGKLSLVSGTDLVLQADMTVKAQSVGGASMELNNSSVSLIAPSKVRCDASVVESSASLVNINSSMVKCSGTLQCDTMIANSVVGASYTPGAGNVW